MKKHDMSMVSFLTCSFTLVCLHTQSCVSIHQQQHDMMLLPYTLSLWGVWVDFAFIMLNCGGGGGGGGGGVPIRCAEFLRRSASFLLFFG